MPAGTSLSDALGNCSFENYLPCKPTRVLCFHFFSVLDSSASNSQLCTASDDGPSRPGGARWPGRRKPGVREACDLEGGPPGRRIGDTPLLPLSVTSPPVMGSLCQASGQPQELWQPRDHARGWSSEAQSNRAAEYDSALRREEF